VADDECRTSDHRRLLGFSRRWPPDSSQSPSGIPGAVHGPAAKPETEPDKRKVGATARRRDDTTFRARSKFRTLPKRRLNVYEP